MPHYTLEELGLVDTDPEPAFTHLAELASHLLGAPVSLVSFVQPERDRQYFKARVGLDLSQTPLSRSFCKHVVGNDESLVVEDSMEDHRVWDNPVIHELNVRAYLGAPVHDPAGAPVAALCVIDDRPHCWSERDRTTLEGLARCVTDAIRLVHELHRSEALRLEQRDYAHGISHDVKGPLQTIGIVLEEVLENHHQDLDPDITELVEMARKTISRTRLMIDDLLDLSSVDEAQDLELVPVEISAVLDEVVQTLGGDIMHRDARVHLPRDLPTVSGDRRQLTMLFQNLVGNALKFHRPGIPPRVRVAWRELDDAVELSVADNGIGIPAEDQARAFRPFKRLGQHEDRNGSGIGLSLVMRVIENHGGTVRIDSDGETGTTFVVRLPRRAASAGRDEAGLPAEGVPIVAAKVA